MTWEKGRDVVEALLVRGHLERVPADPADAAYLLGRAERHLATSARVAVDDPDIAYDALYAAARKALTALLRQQGLRPTREGGHEVVISVAEAQLVPPLASVLRPYRRLRRQRAGSDYAAGDGAVHPDDVLADLPAAQAIVEAAIKILPELTVFASRP